MLSLPMSQDTPLPWIDVPRDTGAFVAAFLKAPAGYLVVGASQYVNLRDWLDVWSSHVGVKARYERMSPEMLTEGDTSGFMGSIVEMFQFLDDFGYAGGDPNALTPDSVGRSAHVVSESS